MTGPGGYNKTLSANTQLTGLAIGTYSVSATACSSAALVVRQVFEPTVTPATVAVAGNDTHLVGVSYALRPGTGILWQIGASILDLGTAIYGYSASQLASSNSEQPSVLLSAQYRPPNLFFAMAFDSRGDLWMSDVSALLGGNSDAILHYSRDTMLAGAGPAATIGNNPDGGSTNPDGGTTIRAVAALAFDPEGNLWAENIDSRTVVKFDQPQSYTGLVAAAPSVTLSLAAGSGGLGMVFDADGGLWLALGNTIAGFVAPGTLSGYSSASPDILLTSADGDGGALNTPRALAFDRSGNLWVANGQGFPVTMISASQLRSSGTVAPTVGIVSTTEADGGPTLIDPSALAFDESGKLWVTSLGSNTLLQYDVAGLTGAQTPTPAAEIYPLLLSGLGVGQIAFDPPPTGLPLAK